MQSMSHLFLARCMYVCTLRMLMKNTVQLVQQVLIVSATRSLTCRDDLDSKWRLLLAENELSRVSLLSRISIEN